MGEQRKGSLSFFWVVKARNRSHLKRTPNWRFVTNKRKIIAGPGNRRGGRGRRRGGTGFKKDNIRAKDGETKAVELEGTVSAVLAGTMFKVQLSSGHEVLAHISGKMRKRFIRLVIGDKVKMEMSPYDTAKARIVYRLG